jgi:hypothetical protein
MPHAKRTGNGGGLTSPNANGPPCARIIRPAGRFGITSPTTTLAAAPIAGARTASLGITDRECRLCFALALWNGKDPILKDRLFGLTGPQGNHGEDVKESYFYLDSTPTHSVLSTITP